MRNICLRRVNSYWPPAFKRYVPTREAAGNSFRHLRKEKIMKRQICLLLTILSLVLTMTLTSGYAQRYGLPVPGDTASQAIQQKYYELGGDGGILGKATTALSQCPDGVGYYIHYEHGSIYWSPSTGAHEVHGAIREKWASIGWEQSLLGYPTTDETDAYGGGKYNDFERGSIYWKFSVGAHEIHGLIRQFWQNAGAERSRFGFPISDESKLVGLSVPSGDRFSDFENGVIYWDFGHPAARELMAIRTLSKDDAFQQMDQVIRPLILATDPNLYLSAHHPGWPERVTGVTDYSVGKDGGVHNRAFQLQYDLGIHVPYFPDPSATLDLTVELAGFNLYVAHITGTLRSFDVHVSVPIPTLVVHSEAWFEAQFTPALNPFVGQPRIIQDVGGNLYLLSLKTMANGDVEAFAVLV